MTVEKFKEKIASNPFIVLNDLVYQYVLDEIINGVYLPGERINSKKIAEALDISRTPVRAALSRLADEKYVEQVGEKGYGICDLDWNDCLALYDVRMIIESTAAYTAANVITEQQLDTLLYTINSLKKAKKEEDDQASFEADNLFHRTIVEASQNNYILEMHDSLSTYLRRYQNALRYTKKYTIKSDDHIVDAHIVIYKAIKNRYSQAAKDEMERHLNHIYRIIFGANFPEPVMRKKI